MERPSVFHWGLRTQREVGLNRSGIHCLNKGIPQYARGASHLYRQICVLASDAERASEILATVADSAVGTGLPDGQPAKKRRLITSAVGIIDIAFGIVGISLAVGLSTTVGLPDVEGLARGYAQFMPIAVAVAGILAIPAGVCVLRRRNRWIAIAGNAALALGLFPLGLLFLGPIVMYKDEFE